ncbi:MAG: bifunctional DNA-formamidopyrimidine glycosylase/DNA-(apurinic or apyrimidinic site) lyase [Betaproteobacteria bacterium]|nr:MAG: bifunctional DNA-formamidopyrimidine glycosylase/DNA-(apurinic or apyrimidinic site) lyase [Betaproteobacteria bacterium]
MPELPEVETVRRSLLPVTLGRCFGPIVVREARLRWPVTPDLASQLAGQRIHALDRRGKYLIFRLDHGGLIVHLGMSGRLQRIAVDTAVIKHDHLDLGLDDGYCLRYNDPRRFGAVLFSDHPESHPLIKGLGLEPLEDGFNGDALYRLTRGRRVTIKAFIMDAHRIVGVGNIYANEALFRAAIRPSTHAGRLGKARCHTLARAITEILVEAIQAGGSTLRDFVDGFGHAGWFQQNYFVYGRAGLACRICATPIKVNRDSGRATYGCPTCQR